MKIENLLSILFVQSMVFSKKKHKIIYLDKVAFSVKYNNLSKKENYLAVTLLNCLKKNLSWSRKKLLSTIWK